MSDLVRAALAYAHRGWRVFPLHGVANGACTCKRHDCSSPDKHPLVRHGLYEGTTDRNKIESWWRHWPQANIGVATGPDSALLVIDVDLPKAQSSLDRLEQLGKKLPETLDRQNQRRRSPSVLPPSRKDTAEHDRPSPRTHRDP